MSCNSFVLVSIDDAMSWAASVRYQFTTRWCFVVFPDFHTYFGSHSIYFCSIGRKLNGRHTFTKIAYILHYIDLYFTRACDMHGGLASPRPTLRVVEYVICNTFIYHIFIRIEWNVWIFAAIVCIVIYTAWELLVFGLSIFFSIRCWRFMISQLLFNDSIEIGSFQ